MSLLSFLRFAKKYGVVDMQSMEMANIGERPRRRNELTNLLLSSGMSGSNSGNNNMKRRKASKTRKSYFYS